MKLPKTAYVLLWFPKPSETFIFREVVNLQRLGLPIEVFTLYGRLSRKLSSEMQAYRDVRRLGIPAIRRLPGDIAYWCRKKPALVRELFGTVPIRRWKTLEFGGENIFAFLCAFTLARMFENENFDHIHAPWAMGPATAAWIASRLTGIPFSFTGRAGDIYPPDGALKEKMENAVFVRTNNRKNLGYLAGFTTNSSKLKLTYNGLTMGSFREAPVLMAPPCRILAAGRFVAIKGFDVLLRAAKRLDEEGLDFQLVIAGAGPRGPQLKMLARTLGLKRRVSFPGFVSHDAISDLFCSVDVFVAPCVVHRTGDRDGIPNVIMEALIHRLPVVATNVSAISEVIIDRKTGLLVPARDPRALAEAVRKVLMDRDGSLAMAERGRSLVLDLFDPVKNAGKIIDLYSNAAGAKCGQQPGSSAHQPVQGNGATGSIP
ncbi:MAG: glycosyltransferase [Syntrophobacteraceae bacterium]